MEDQPRTHEPEDQATPDAAGTPSLRPSVDELSEWSFPASDAPAVWTWEVERPPEPGR